MKKILLLTLLPVMLSSLLQAQLQYGKVYDQSGERFYFDTYGRCYILNKNQIISISPAGEIKRYAGANSHRYTQIDVSDPFELIAYESNFNSLKIFNNELNLITEISAFDLFPGYTSLNFIRTKASVYILPVESPDLYEYSLNFKHRYTYSDFIKPQPYPLTLLAIGNKIIAADPSGCIYISEKPFSNYKTIETEAFKSVRYKSNLLQLFNPETKTIRLLSFETSYTHNFKFPDTLQINDAAYINQRLWLLTNSGVYYSERYNIQEK